MPAKIVAPQSAVFTADGTANGFATVGSNTGFFVGAQANISDSTGRSDRVVITALVSTNQLGLKIIAPLPAAVGTNPWATTQVPLAPNYGRSSLAAYTLANASKIDMEAQIVYDPDNTLNTT